MEIDVIIMKYKTTKALLEVDRDFYVKNGDNVAENVATKNINLINDFIEDLEKFNEANN